MSNMKVGIIGAGNISAAYLRLSPMFKGFEITAVADISADAAKARAQEFGVHAMSVDEMLASDNIDVIVNLTIPAAHFDVTHAILSAGKHAYSEKPIVLSKEQADTLVNVSREAGLRVGSAPDTFLGGAHQHARAVIDSGEVGPIMSGTAHVMSTGMEHWHPNPDFFFQPGAGPILDIGPYYIANLIQLLGPVARVAALSQTPFKERKITSEPRNGEMIPVDTPTTFHALLDFVSGASITLGASWDVMAHRHANMELYGTQGALFVPDPNFFGGQLQIATERNTVRSLDLWDHPFNVFNEGTDSANPQANYRGAGLADMIAGLNDGRPHRCSLELACHTVDVMTSILAAADAKQFVDITSSCDRPAPLTPALAQDLLA